MFIKHITIEGVQGDVEIRRIEGAEGGAIVTAGGRTICEMHCSDDRERRYAMGREAAKAICGVTRASRFGPAEQPNATNSMIHDVLCEIERVAGC